MMDAQRREQAAREQSDQREHKLQEQINQLLRELGHKEGELEALRAQGAPAKPKGWWARLLGEVSNAKYAVLLDVVDYPNSSCCSRHGYRRSN